MSEIAGPLLQQMAAKFRRILIVGVLSVGFGVAAIYQFSIALLLALEPQVGLIGARVLVGVADLVVVLAAIGGAAWSARWAAAAPTPAAAPAAGPRSGQPRTGPPRTGQWTMIVEAVLLGYSLARRMRD